ncbi:periplasmic nitrate reductase, NapE protein [Shewanella sp.]|uniref:periplasmic nitrate reductase, NapE protein n=1 Tax=Shewanella sp. TaxID=50422 RepID=UPI0035639125
MSHPSQSTKENRSRELKGLGFIVFLLFPALTVTFISLYGLALWVFQAVTGVAPH